MSIQNPSDIQDEGYGEDELQDLLNTDKNYGYPTPPSKDSIFKFFREIIGLEDSSKTGNVGDVELGKLKHSVRRYQEVALMCESFGYDRVRDYLGTKSEIVLSTGLSKKGFLPQLFVTQIKKEQKVKKEGMPAKGNWFSPAKPSVGGEE